MTAAHPTAAVAVIIAFVAVLILIYVDLRDRIT